MHQRDRRTPGDSKDRAYAKRRAVKIYDLQRETYMTSSGMNVFEIFYRTCTMVDKGFYYVHMCVNEIKTAY